jgi:Protein of unknown function (DUF3995)
VGYGIVAWALLFSVPHVYWGLGGREGMAATLGSLDVLGDPVFVAAGTWGVACLCGVAVLFGLAIALPRLRVVPRRLLRAGAVLAAIPLSLDLVVKVVQFGLIQLGVLPPLEVPAGWVMVHTQLLVWAPVFLVGAVLFWAAAWALRSRPRRSRPATVA